MGHALPAGGHKPLWMPLPVLLLLGEQLGQLGEGHPFKPATVDLDHIRLHLDGKARGPVNRPGGGHRPLEGAGIDRVQMDGGKPLGQQFQLAAALVAHLAVGVALEGAPPVALRLAVAHQV